MPFAIGKRQAWMYSPLKQATDTQKQIHISNQYKEVALSLQVLLLATLLVFDMTLKVLSID